MPTFTSRTKSQMQNYDEPAPAPVREPLCKVSDGTAVNNFYMKSKTDTVEDVIGPGYFNFMRDTFLSGASRSVVHFVTCHLGDVAEGLTAIDLHLVNAPRSLSEPVIMAAGPVQRFTLPTADKSKAA